MACYGDNFLWFTFIPNEIRREITPDVAVYDGNFGPGT
jgi:hypothetical protein